MVPSPDPQRVLASAGEPEEYARHGQRHRRPRVEPRRENLRTLGKLHVAKTTDTDREFAAPREVGSPTARRLN